MVNQSGGGRPNGWREKAVELGESLYIIAGAGWLMIKPLMQSLATGAFALGRAASAWWRTLDAGSQRRLTQVVGGALAVLYLMSWLEPAGHWLAYQQGKRPLYAAKSWHYQLDKGDLDTLAKIKADAMVIDYATGGGKAPLTAADVARLKIGPDGKKRFVIAYLSVGEAEQYRFYFREEWKTDPPEWLGAENCQWPGAHKVTFWHDSWKDIVWRGRKSYLKRIVDAGFDGVYLDRVDIYDQYQDRPTARDDMIQFVTDLSATAKKLKPGFFVIPQNADDLLNEPEYRAVVDGLGREDLLYGAHETGKRNPSNEISEAQQRLNLLLWEWKPVFAVEYLQTTPAIDAARKEMLSRGLVPTFQARGLDGTEPTAPVDLKKDVGTSEYAKANCAKGTTW
jgi:cysteinyl-tRNA synthetase, unknown class